MHTFELQEQQHVKQSNNQRFVTINNFHLKLTVFSFEIQDALEPQEQHHVQ
jgi:hypothetical protein